MNNIYLSHWNIYGSERHGLFATKLPDADVGTINTDNPLITNNKRDIRILGSKNYQLKDHLGNVRLVFTDRKIPFDLADFAPFSLEVVAANNYYSYGSLQGGGQSYASEQTRYSYNGMEMDKEFGITGKSYTTEFREYNSDIGRWWSVDPVVHEWESPFTAFGNNPILFSDPRGDDFYKNNYGTVKWVDDNVKEFSEKENEEEVNWANIGTEFLEFNGKSLKYSWQITNVEGDRSVYSKEYLAVSGSAKSITDESTKEVKLFFDYSVERQKMINIGPIPEGIYSITKSSLSSRNDPSNVITSTFRALGLGFNKESWGDYRWSLHPEQASTFGRGGFFIHGGFEWGSIGCIDLTGGINNFTYLLFNNSKSFNEKTYLKVSYNNNLLINIKPINPKNYK